MQRDWRFVTVALIPAVLCWLTACLEESPCSTDFECPSHMRCVGNGAIFSTESQCVPRCGSGESLVGDRCVGSVECSPECGEGFDCRDGICVASLEGCEPPCADGHLCVDGSCSDVSGECAPPCADPFSCREGQCVEVDCSEDTCAARSLQCGSFVTECGTEVDCGGCPDGQECDQGICGCEERSAVEFCALYGWECGTLTASDCIPGVGVDMRSEMCGTCLSPSTCGGDGVEGQCGCRQSDAEFCDANNVECGGIVGVDACGRQREVSCGTCAAPETCGGGGAEFRCGCSPELDVELCAQVGRECGSHSVRDRCGVERDISCGGCEGAEMCLSSGTCCKPDTDLELCTDLGKVCGSHFVTDNCGVARMVDCDAAIGCDSPTTCASHGGCCEDKRTEAQVCSDANADCGTIEYLDCGVRREATCQYPAVCPWYIFGDGAGCGLGGTLGNGAPGTPNRCGGGCAGSTTCDPGMCGWICGSPTSGVGADCGACPNGQACVHGYCT